MRILTEKGKEKRELTCIHALYLGTRLPKLYAFKIDMKGVLMQKRI
jgi:hypothetical protein